MCCIFELTFYHNSPQSVIVAHHEVTSSAMSLGCWNPAEQIHDLCRSPLLPSSLPLCYTSYTLSSDDNLSVPLKCCAIIFIYLFSLFFDKLESIRLMMALAI